MAMLRLREQGREEETGGSKKKTPPVVNEAKNVPLVRVESTRRDEDDDEDLNMPEKAV